MAQNNIVCSFTFQKIEVSIYFYLAITVLFSSVQLTVLFWRFAVICHWNISYSIFCSITILTCNFKVQTEYALRIFSKITCMPTCLIQIKMNKISLFGFSEHINVIVALNLQNLFFFCYKKHLTMSTHVYL